MKAYRTAEIAGIIGVHPNTVRFYEEQGLLPPVPREKNGYRVYSECHLLQLRLIRLAFRAEILSDNLRGEAIGIVKAAAGRSFQSAVKKARAYRDHIREEMDGAREAIHLAKQVVDGHAGADSGVAVGRREAAARLGVSMDVLRDWERNGLLQVPREAGRRQYGPREMDRLKIISVLRRANYSQMAIRRMLAKLEHGETDLLASLDTPEPTEDIVTASDRYITSLSGARRDAAAMLRLLDQMKHQI